MHAIYIGSSYCSARLIICDMALKFQQLVITTRCHCSSLEIEKNNNAKYRQIDFFSFIFKREARSSSSEMFGITKLTNQVLICSAYQGQIKLNVFNNLSMCY